MYNRALCLEMRGPALPDKRWSPGILCRCAADTQGLCPCTPQAFGKA